MKLSIVKNVKHSVRLKKSIRLITHHPNGDNYDGIVLSCTKDVILLQYERDFIFDGVIAFPPSNLKDVRMGKLERSLDRIFSKFEPLKKIKYPSWILKTKSINEIIRECRRRRIWPIVEARRKGKTSLFIGPVTEVGTKSFCLFAYDAEGKWEKNYVITYEQVLRIQLFDAYSKYFNGYMKSRIKPGMG